MISTEVLLSPHLQDKQLSKEEVLADMDLFVGSQATDFGEYMMRHDEF